MTRPTRTTRGGRAFLDLQIQARRDGRTTAEYLRLYALEGFLLRLAHSRHRDSFVLKGGVLLAAYELRRPTADVDVVGLRMSNDIENVQRMVVEVMQAPLPPELGDGLTFDPASVTAEAIRDEDRYSGVRVRLLACLASAREPFHVDVSLGDPVWPAPVAILLPRLIDTEPIRLRGYPLELVLSEKIITALQRGTANTRWRDFADIHLLVTSNTFGAMVVTSSLRSVASHRQVSLVGLDEVLTGFAEIGQFRWAAWRAKLQLAAILPEDFGQVLATVLAFANPILTGAVDESAIWNPAGRVWQLG